MRTILYTGKGGVGKTTVAAATALRASQLGYKTIVISTDAAHSLGDSLDTPLTATPLQVADNLWAQEIDVLHEMEHYWGTVRDWLTALMRWQGVEEWVAEEVAEIPGMGELTGLLYITRYDKAADYDVLVVDCAPTGETLRLLSFPDMARWYMHRLFPISRRTAQAIRPIVKPILGLPLPNAKVFDSIESLYHQLETIKEIMSRPSASVRLVMNPEKMVIKETQRTFTYLNLYGYSTDLIVCNKVLPDEVSDAYFARWKESQAKYIQLIAEAFSPIPIRNLPLMAQEVTGLELLNEVATALFGSEDPASLFFQGRVQEITRGARGYTLNLPLPFMSREQVSLLRSSDELTVQAGAYRRTIILPRLLATLQVEEAVMENGTLRLSFATKNASRPKRPRNRRPSNDS